MFNHHLKKQLQDQSTELFMARQLDEQMDAHGLIIELDPQFKVIAVNENFACALGYRAEQLNNRPMADIVPAYVKNLPCFHNFRAAVGKCEPIGDDYRYIRSNGGLAWLHVDWFPLRDPSGQLVKIKGYAREVTEEIQTAKENAEFINALIRSTAVIQFNLDGTIITANEQFLRGMGYTLPQIVGKHHSMFCSPALAGSPEYKSFWQTLNRGEYVSSRFQRIDSRGRDVWLEASYNPVYDAEGTLYKVVKFASVVTDQVQREEEVREAARIAYDISRQTDTSAERGAAVVQETMTTMQRVAAEVDSATRSIEALGNSRY